MQNAKDTFYEWLRGRVAQLNPARTTVVRGVLRPGVLVEENELPAAASAPAECFRLRWMGLEAVDAESAPPLIRLRVEVAYATAGTAANGGMDRGRLLNAMDAELSAALTGAGRNVPKQDFSGVENGAGAAAMATRVWWSAPEFGVTKIAGARLERVAAVELWSYEEAGER